MLYAVVRYLYGHKDIERRFLRDMMSARVKGLQASGIHLSDKMQNSYWRT